MYPDNPVIDVLGHQIDGRWRRIHFERAPFGVPAGLFSPEATQRGYVSYASAMALGYWLLAAAKMQGVEFRLVTYTVVTDTKVTRGREGQSIQQSYTWELPPAVDAVDPHVASTGKPSTRE
jgi:hypothetical protein